MADWETLKQETLNLDGNNFLEINLKLSPDKENTFIGLSKGWYTDKKEKRYKSNILITENKKEELISILSNLKN